MNFSIELNVIVVSYFTKNVLTFYKGMSFYFQQKSFPILEPY